MHSVPTKLFNKGLFNSFFSFLGEIGLAFRTERCFVAASGTYFVMRRLLGNGKR